MADRLEADAVQVGDEAPALSHTLTRTDLVMYAGASGRLQPDAHRRGRGPGRRAAQRVRPRHVLDGPARHRAHRLRRRRQPAALQGPLHQADLARRGAAARASSSPASARRAARSSSTSSARWPTATARSRSPARPWPSPTDRRCRSTTTRSTTTSWSSPSTGPRPATPSTSTTSATWPGRGRTSATTTTPGWPSSPACPGNFMSGADLKTYIPQITELAEEIGTGEVDRDRRLPARATAPGPCCATCKLYKPIIAAVDGPCVAGGMEMLGGHRHPHRHTRTPRFGVMEPKRGLFAGGGTTARLPRQLAFPAAMEFLLTAEAFPAARALELGPAQRDRRAGRADRPGRASGPAASCANAPLAVQATKESVLRGLATTFDEAYEHRAGAGRHDLRHRGRQGGPEGLRREAARPAGLARTAA